MLHLAKIVFVDDETKKEISVSLNGKVEATSGMTPEEYCIASYHAGLIVSAGLSEISKLMKK